MNIIYGNYGLTLYYAFQLALHAYTLFGPYDVSVIYDGSDRSVELSMKNMVLVVFVLESMFGVKPEDSSI